MFCRDQYPRLVRLLGLYLGDVELAQDLAQEALLRVWRRWDHVSALESPPAWAQRVAMNLATSSLRSRLAGWRAHRRLEDQWRPLVEVDRADVIAVRRALAELPARQREALLLRYYADLPVEAVARAMGCPAGTVKTLTARAIAALRSKGLEVDE